MVLLELSMSPMDKGESVSEYVARSMDIIDRSGLEYKIGPMGTCIEGEWDEVLAVVKQCFEKMREDCNRITASIKLDYRKGYSGRIKLKVQSAENKVGRKLKQ